MLFGWKFVNFAVFVLRNEDYELGTKISESNLTNESKNAFLVKVNELLNISGKN